MFTENEKRQFKITLSRLKSIKKYIITSGAIITILTLLMLFLPVNLHQSTPSNLITIGLSELQPNAAYATSTLDYNCDGTDDDVQFQMALDALPTTGGTIRVVRTGTYNFSNTVSRAIDNVIIEGVGQGVYFANDGATAIFDAGSQDGWVFRDFSTDAGGVDVGTATTYRLENVTFGATYYPITYTDGYGDSYLSIDTTTTGNVTVGGSLVSDGILFPVDDGSGIKIYGVSGESLSAGHVCFLDTDDKFWKADADVSANSTGMLVLALSNVSADVSTTFLAYGYSVNTNWSVNEAAILYLSTTTGNFTETAPSGSGDIVRIIGYGIDDSDTIFFDPDKSWVELE